MLTNIYKTLLTFVFAAGLLTNSFAHRSSFTEKQNHVSFLLKHQAKLEKAIPYGTDKNILYAKEIHAKALRTAQSGLPYNKNLAGILHEKMFRI